MFDRVTQSILNDTHDKNINTTGEFAHRTEEPLKVEHPGAVLLLRKIPIGRVLTVLGNPASASTTAGAMAATAADAAGVIASAQGLSNSANKIKSGDYTWRDVPETVLSAMGALPGASVMTRPGSWVTAANTAKRYGEMSKTVFTPIPQKPVSTVHFDPRVKPTSRPISEAERLGIPKGERSNPKALEDPQYWGYQQWNDRYNAAVKADDMAEAQRLRDLHFRLHAKNNVIVDGSGMPIEVYHGSPEEFNIFDYTRTAKYPEGHFFFGEDFDYVRSHARRRAFTENNKDYNVKSYYLYDTEKYPINKNKIDPKIVPIITNRQGYPLENELSSDSASYIMTRFQDKPHIIYGYDVGRDYVPGKYDYAVPFNTQMKLTDPITYNKGEIIPIVKRDNFHNPDIRHKQGGILKAQRGTGLAGIPIIGNLAKKGFELVAKRSNGAQTKSIPTIIGDVITGRDKSFYNENNSNGSNEIDTYLYGKPYNSEFTGDASLGPDYTNYINKNYPNKNIKTYNTHFGDTLYIDDKAKDLVEQQLNNNKVVGGLMGRYAHAPSYIVTTENGRPYDAGGHLIKFSKDENGNVVANMSDIYDFLPEDFNDKYNQTKNPSWTRNLANNIGTPFIVRQNNIPVVFKEIVPEYKTEKQKQLGDFLSQWGNTYDLKLPLRLSDKQIDEIFDGRDYGDDILDFMMSKGYIKPVYKSGGILKGQHGILTPWYKAYNSKFGKGVRTLMFGKDHDLSDEEYVQKYGYAKPITGTGMLPGKTSMNVFESIEGPLVKGSFGTGAKYNSGLQAMKTKAASKLVEPKTVSNWDKFLKKSLDEQNKIVKYWDERYSTMRQLQANQKQFKRFVNWINKQ